MPAPATTVELLEAALRRDGSRPLLTWYGPGEGERVELSVATFATWVAKAAGLLRDELGLEQGGRVAALLPAHWQALVLAAGCWTAGGRVVVGDPGGAAVAAAAPDRLDEAIAGDADEVLAFSLHPLAAPVPGELPPGVVDFGREALPQPDRFVGSASVGPDEPAVDAGGQTHSHADLLGLARFRASSADVPAGGRLLAVAGDLDLGALVDLLVLPLLVDGSAVLVAGGDPARLAHVAEQERVDITL